MNGFDLNGLFCGNNWIWIVVIILILCNCKSFNIFGGNWWIIIVLIFFLLPSFRGGIPGFGPRPC